MEDTETPKREWQGTWIPREIWQHTGLSWMEKCLWAEIKNLEDKKKGGCWASNVYLAKIMGTTTPVIANTIGKFRKIGIIKNVSFDGRKRVILAIWNVRNKAGKSKTIVKAALTCGLMQHSSTDEGRLHPQINIDTSVDTSLDTPPTPLKGDGTPDCDSFDTDEQAGNQGDQSDGSLEIDDGATNNKPHKNASLIEYVYEKWNAAAEENGWNKIVRMTDSRRKKIATRVKDKFFTDNLDRILKFMANDDFYSGANDRRWRPTIDYILNPSSLDRLVEKAHRKPTGPKKIPEPEGWREIMQEIVDGPLAPLLSDYPGIQHIEEYDRLPVYAKDLIRKQIYKKAP